MIALLVSAVLQPAPPPPSPQELWRVWPEERATTTAAPCLRPAELAESLEKLAARFPDDLELEEVGKSFERRPIHLMTLGRGARKVLLWSQMHGDEPSATPALLDVAAYLLDHPDDPAAGRILDELTLLMVPMLNPDGSEIYERRNAQGIDVNRDALNLATPEGRLLKRLRDEHEPILGFNLHDQNRRTAVGETGKLATNAVLAVAGDPEGTLTPGRARAKRACAAIVKALAPLMPGGMARYDEDWSPRAFGDNLTAWGTPVVLIESGGMPPGRDLTDLTRLNFVALLSVLADLARDDLAGHDPELYEVLERNQRGPWTDVLVRGGRILQPGTAEAYRADLSFDRLRDDRSVAGCRIGDRAGSQITEIGDARFLAGGREVDASGGLVVAPFEVGVEGWSARRWLDADTLAALARLGVGELRWAVQRRRLSAAESLARTLAATGGEGATRLTVLEAPAELPRLRISGPPADPGTESLAVILDALGGARDLASLWPEAAGLPALRPGRPASFLVVSPWSESDPEAAGARLVEIWLDGAQVKGKK